MEHPGRISTIEITLLMVNYAEANYNMPILNICDIQAFSESHRQLLNTAGKSVSAYKHLSKILY